MFVKFLTRRPGKFRRLKEWPAPSRHGHPAGLFMSLRLMPQKALIFRVDTFRIGSFLFLTILNGASEEAPAGLKVYNLNQILKLILKQRWCSSHIFYLLCLVD